MVRHQELEAAPKRRNHAMRRRKSFGRFLDIVGIILLVLVLAAGTLFFNELRSLISLKQLDAYPLYSMTYYGDYGFDDFLKVGAKSDKDIERFVIKRLLKGVNIDLGISDAGCSAFTASNEKNERIYARNFDFDFAPPLIVHTSPKNGYRSVSTVNLAFAGYNADRLPKPLSVNSFLTLAAPYLPFDGMNETGLTMALLAVPRAEPPQKESQITLNTTTAIRLVLDKAATVGEALDLLGQYNIYFSADVACHYFISDISGQSVIVEFLDGEMKVTPNSANYQAVTNFIVYNGINEGEGFCEFERYDKIMAVLKATKGVISEDQAMKVLEAVKIPGKTQWSVVYNMVSKQARICVGEEYDHAYTVSLVP
jgi:hypothetical protein